ncbi:hypothetical protein [Emticicia sp. 21SJ11W-3]|uniref:hypothetical protein n=1 Tax=Emticicia sp. 21SJ11W-3 TaxID=2916755 RepID=UPI00209D99B9|nr:hypothetical protein [Emticicia sp. 21SJ11W-3]UTA69299.1 hypothetical protein MB380_05710 [Emticicia sp. 21SJ11W-3]
MSTKSLILINPFSGRYSYEEKLFFWLRFGVLGCFVGHGFWGLVLKKGWVPFFKVFFIDEPIAYNFMPVIGTMDILIGLVVFFYPNRALLLWASFWTLFTAMLRPSASMGMSEFFERAGNYGIPILFLLLHGLPATAKQWFEKLKPLGSVSYMQASVIEWVSRLSLFSLLAGHGGLAVFMNHPTLIKNMTGVGLPMTGVNLHIFGLVEIALAFLVLLKPRIPGLLIFICLYKLGYELLFPIVGNPIDIFETIERMGDYVLPIILFEYYRSKYFNQSRQHTMVPKA